MPAPALRTLFLRLVRRASWSLLTLDEVVRRFDTPRKVDDYMQACFEYAHDHELFGEEELWQPPERTFERRRGDCEDYALFAWHVLRQHGFDARLFAAFTQDEGHAVCAFEERGAWHAICNQGLRRFGVRRSGSGRAARTRLARGLAERIYPRRWIACSYVVGLAETLAPDGTRERLHPEYRWVYPR